MRIIIEIIRFFLLILLSILNLFLTLFYRIFWKEDIVEENIDWDIGDEEIQGFYHHNPYLCSKD